MVQVLEFLFGNEPAYSCGYTILARRDHLLLGRWLELMSWEAPWHRTVAQARADQASLSWEVAFSDWRWVTHAPAHSYP